MAEHDPTQALNAATQAWRDTYLVAARTGYPVHPKMAEVIERTAVARAIVEFVDGRRDAIADLVHDFHSVSEPVDEDILEAFVDDVLKSMKGALTDQWG